jgi:hypothetical protein
MRLIIVERMGIGFRILYEETGEIAVPILFASRAEAQEWIDT